MIDKNEFEKLDPGAQAKIFRESNLADKRDLLLYSHEPARLTQSLSLEELYLLTRQTELEERSEIIRFAALSQLFFIADMDCWKKDRMDPEGFVGWLETLQKADEKKLLAWLLLSDYETIVAGFKGIVRVVKPDWEYARDEVLGDEAFFTIDEQYHVFVKEENYETVRRAFEILFENHRGRYTAILEGILGELDDVIVEEAFENRSKRLTDRGFPDQESARRIFRPVSEKEFWEFPKKKQNGKKDSGLEQVAAMPNYLMFWNPERLFFDEALLLLNEGPQAELEGIQEELAWLSNKVLASEGIDFSSEEKIREGIERARRMVSIGLELLSGGNVGKAKQILRERWLEIIFRYAANEHMHLRDRSRDIAKKYWDNSYPALLDFLNEPYGPIFRGLLQNFPHYHEEEPRDFKNLREIQLASRAVEQIAAVHEFLFKKYPSLKTDMASAEKSSEDGMSLITLLASLFASYTQNKKKAKPRLKVEEAKAFVREGFEKRGARLYLKAEWKDKFLSEFFSKEESDLLRPLFGLAFQELEEQLGGITDFKSADFRFIDCLWVESSGKHLKVSRSR